jgi:hypothetical protein
MKYYIEALCWGNVNFKVAIMWKASAVVNYSSGAIYGDRFLYSAKILDYAKECERDKLVRFIQKL